MISSFINRLSLWSCSHPNTTGSAVTVGYFSTPTAPHIWHPYQYTQEFPIYIYIHIHTYYYYCYSYFFLLFTIIIIVYYWYLLLLLYIYCLLLLIIYYYTWHHILLNSCINSCIYHVYHHFSTCDLFVTLLPVSFTVELNKSGKPQAPQKRSVFFFSWNIVETKQVLVCTCLYQLSSTHFFFSMFLWVADTSAAIFLRHSIKKPQTRHLFKGIWVETHVISWFFH